LALPLPAAFPGPQIKTAAPSPRRPRRTTRRRVTMTDVAREAGCSQATVSFVLNRNDAIKISPQMRERVFAAARTLGYAALPATEVPSEVEFATGEMIGFAVDQLSTSPEAVVAIEGARQAAWAAGNIILVAQTQSDAKMEPKTLRALTGKGVAA